MKLIVDVDEKLVCEGFERSFTEEERAILIRAIGNGTPYNPTGDTISRDSLKKSIEEKATFIDGDSLYKIIDIIDNAPIAPLPDFKDGYKQAIIDGKTNFSRMQVQVELVEKLKDRIEKRVCKHCQMNKNCVLCEISRVFQIIELTTEELKGGSEND